MTHPLLLLAGKVALTARDIHYKNFVFGGVCVRKDGAITVATNGAVQSSQVSDYRMIPNAHCEGRLLLKADQGATLYITRLLKKDRSMAMSRPCAVCRARILARKINKVFYTIDPFHYGIWNVATGEERIVEC